PKSLIEGFFNASKAFFALPVEVKKKYEIPGMAGQRGYTSFGKEHAKQSNVADLKEFYQIGQELPDNHALKSECPDNIDVAEESGFVDSGRHLYREFEKAGSHLLKAIAIHLNLPENYFDQYINGGNSI
ncbi:MAG: 2-oxoglutarate and iron-dependent oxygenase domain-containing protein, partial [Bacteroidota bacterium]